MSRNVRNQMTPTSRPETCLEAAARWRKASSFAHADRAQSTNAGFVRSPTVLLPGRDLRGGELS